MQITVRLKTKPLQMKSLIELFEESTNIKSEINILVSESNNHDNPLETRLSLLKQITFLHTRLNALLKEINDRRSNKLDFKHPFL
jgi:hypothetical protein